MLIHIIWWTIPTLLLLMSLWSWLEGRKNPMRKDEASDLFKNAIFVLGCIGLSYLIEIYLLESLASIFVGFLPLGFLQALTLPCVLWLGAMLIGPSMQIRIPPKSGKSYQAANSKKRR